jgi:hypothetical protein
MLRAFYRGQRATPDGGNNLPGEFVPTTNSLSAALAFVESMEPENEVQAALAVNAACLQAASTNLLSRIPKSMGERSAPRLAAAIARLERSFHSALETYYKLKRGNTRSDPSREAGNPGRSAGDCRKREPRLRDIGRRECKTFPRMQDNVSSLAFGLCSRQRDHAASKTRRSVEASKTCT